MMQHMKCIIHVTTIFAIIIQSLPNSKALVAGLERRFRELELPFLFDPC